jgi:hypothetical protein
MSRGSHASSSRTLHGLAGLVIVGVMALGSTALIAAPADQPASNGTARLMTSPGDRGDTRARLLTWSGRVWLVYPNGSKGPQNVPMTNSTDAAWVDEKGWLHLKIVKIDGEWRSVQLQSLYPVTYGRYRLINDTATAKFADTVILGMFVYRPHSRKYTNEIDIENSRFPHYLKAPNNAQFAVQPYYAPDHEHPYSVRPSYKPLLQQFTWYPPVNGSGTVEFLTRVGNTPKAPLLARWTYNGYSVPLANDGSGNPMYLYLNLWLNKGRPPVGGTHSAVLRSLTFKPLGD